MRASEDMNKNYIIVAVIVVVVACLACVGLASDTVTGILGVVLTPFRWILHLFGISLFRLYPGLVQLFFV